MGAKLNYGNWIRKKILIILGICSLITGILSLLPFGLTYRLVMLFLFAVILISFLFPLYTYFMVSQKGGRFQDKIFNLIIQQLGSPITGQLLDIGCGNGVLAVKLAQKYTEAKVLGMDYWGKNWEYSKEVCENNAIVGEVDNRIHFQKGDAAKLEFANETYDGVVSNLTFHEVASVSDKREVVREALRVVKTGGRFTFVDYFYNGKIYGPTAEFRNYLQSLNLSHFEIRPLHEMLDLPILMRHPKILGKAGILFGRK